MEFLLTQASLLNSSAIHLLQSGNSSDAFAQFRRAIQVISRCTCIESSLEQAAGADSVECKTVGQIPLARISGMPTTDNSLMASVYEFTPEGEELTLERIAYYSAVVIYNCAVCLHQRGSPMGLVKASHLYAQCLDLLEPIQSQQDCANLMESVLQNQANIYYNLGDFYRVRHTMDKLFLVTQRKRILSGSAITIAPEA